MESPQVLHGGTVGTPTEGGGTGSTCGETAAAGENFKSAIRRGKICCLGAGYVGGPTMAVIASKCPELEVFVADICVERIAQWNGPHLPIYEPGLEEMVTACRGRNLTFTTNVAQCVRDCDIIFVAVNTPTKTFGVGQGRAADMTAWELASRAIAEHALGSKIVIEKSTVPVRTAESLRRVLACNASDPQIEFAILSNPEFLAEGTAIRDLLNPDRVLIGGDAASPVGQHAISCLEEIYARWVDRSRIVTVNTWSSELAKLVANAYLAQRVSSINAVAMLADKCGADVREIARAVGHDSRIGSKFLNASVGFGGSCLEKDVLSLAYLCEFYGLREAAQYWSSVKEMNDLQKRRFSQRILHEMFDTVNRKKVAVFGFAFKKDTGDVRATPALGVCKALMADGAMVQLYDPKVEVEAALREFRAAGVDENSKPQIRLDVQFKQVSSPEEAVTDAHAIVVLTEWDCFKTYDYARFYALMKKPAFVFDGRNLLDHELLHSIGFEVHGVGVPTLRQQTVNCTTTAAKIAK